ncbi:MAG: tetratricopeptide repeat protein [Cyanobacteria bacterium SIG28]|nr:tetratricopeptide repeat protein [Cyanobacteria bacterium SIG28]
MAGIDEIKNLVANKEFEEAHKIVEAEPEESLKNIEFLKLAGLVEINLELWENAKKYFESAVKYETDDATSWFYLGNCYEKLGDKISAKNAYLKVIELRTEYIEAYVKLCVIFIQTNDNDNAIKYAQTAAQLDSENYLYDFIEGTALLKKGDSKNAAIALEKAVEKNPKNVDSLNSLGNCYVSAGEFEKALKTYQTVLEINPKLPMGYYNIGIIYQIQQNHKLACDFFEKAIEIKEDETFLTSLAMSEVKLCRFEKALEHYKQLALMNPGKENFKYNLAICYEALGENDTAIKLLEEIVYVNPKFIPPAQRLASLYLKKNQLVKAKEIYDNILLKHNITADIIYEYAILSSSLCDTDTAEKMLKKVIKMNPNIAKAHKDLGIVYLNKRLFDYAEDEFKIALNIAPNDFDIIFEYANFLYSISKNKEAEEYYIKSLEIQPQNVIALTFIALNYLVLNKLDEAKEYIMKAITIEPNHEYVQFCTGRILFAKGDFEDAKRYLIHAVEQNPDVETQNTLALTYFELGEYQQALNIFTNIETKSSKSVSVLMDIARCYEKLEQNEKALEYLYKVTDIFPDNEDAHDMIRKLS